MARVTYQSKDNAGHRFWVARYGRYAIRRGVHPWLISVEGRSVRQGIAPDRDQAAAAVSEALDELPRQQPWLRRQLVSTLHIVR